MTEREASLRDALQDYFANDREGWVRGYNAWRTKARSALADSATLHLSDRQRIEREVAGALASAIDAHGPITRANHASAAKRIIGATKLVARVVYDASSSAAVTGEDPS